METTHTGFNLLCNYDKMIKLYCLRKGRKIIIKELCYFASKGLVQWFGLGQYHVECSGFDPASY